MAYNPFDFFRRNQKLFFGGLTILVMFMFILSFGPGDFFSQASNWIGKWQTTGEVMAVIDGSKIKESQLRDLGAERGLANGYMLQAAERAMVAAEKAAMADSKAAGPDYRDRLTQIAEFAQRWRYQRPRSADEAAGIRQTLAVLSRGLRNDVEGASGVKAEDAKAAKAVRLFAEGVLGDLVRRSAGEKGEAGVYFVNQPNRTDRDRLEFMLWRKKADQLGIRFTHEHVTALVDAEFPTLTQEELKELARKTAGSAGRKSGELMDALADEFRVRAAQAAVIGLGEVRDPTADPPGTAEDRFEHFVEETTATRYTFLALPVEAYLPLVQGQPTEAELLKIFNDGSGSDPDPGSSRPGIREPRKVGVQWVEITGREPYYDALAARRVQGIPLAQAVFGATLASVADPFKPVQYDDYLKGQADAARFRLRWFANPGKPSVGQDVMATLGGGLAVDPEAPAYPENARTDAKFNSSEDRLLDAEVIRPDVAVALAGLTAGALATNGTPLAPAVAVTESAYRQSRERRVVAGIQAFHIPLLPGVPELGEWVGGEAAVVAGSPAPLPEVVVRPVLDRLSADGLRAAVATEDVQAFEKELARRMKEEADKTKPDEKAKVRAEAAQYVKDWIALRQVKTGQTEKPRDVHSLADDDGLKPLLEKDLGVLAFGMPKNVRAKTAFGMAFTNDGDFAFTPDFQVITKMKPAGGLYQVRQYDPWPQRKDERTDYAPFTMGAPQVTDSKPLTLVWRTAEVTADRPLSLAASPTAREKCKAIWRLNKARELARKAADEAAGMIAQAGADEVKLAQQVQEVLAHLKKPIADPLLAARFVERTPPEFEAAKLPLQKQFGLVPMVAQFDPRHDGIVYETDKMKEDLLANKDKPVGSTFVFTDRPETTLYLTVVSGRERKSADDFRNFVLYPNREAINQVRQQQQRMMQLGQPPKTHPLAPEEIAPRYAAAARDADRQQAVALLKAEFGYTDENPKLDQKDQ